MRNPMETRRSLLLRIRDTDDDVAWSQFVEIYAPLVHDFGRHKGLQDADAADLAQDVLQAVAKSVEKFEYDPRKGTFRGWLLSVTRHKLCDLLERLRKRERAGGDSKIAKTVDVRTTPEEEDKRWERRHQWFLVRWAANQLRCEFEDATWEAFMKTALENQKAASVAEDLGVSVGAVYIAKSRVLSRVKELVQSLEEDESSQRAGL